MFCTFYCLQLSPFCKTAHKHWTYENVCRVSCGDVSNMLLVQSITFYFHYIIWGCMCSIGPFQFRWFKGYIYSSCCNHHQIGSIHLSHDFIFSVAVCLRCLLHHILSLMAYTFRENREFVSIIIAQFMRSATSRICFGLQILLVCLYIHRLIIIFPLLLRSLWGVQQVGYVLACRSYSFVCTFTVSLSSLCKIIWRPWTYQNICQIYVVECVRWGILSHLSIMQYVGLCFAV